MERAIGIEHSGELDVNFFPQFRTGAPAQFPLVRRRRISTVTNLLTDGSAVTYIPTAPAANIWELTLQDLTDAEADSLQSLFQAVEGRMGTFTFLDPAGNLLAHSEELDGSCWTKGPMLQLTPGVDDATGGTRAIRVVNAGQTTQALAQALGAPAWFGYCFSVYARSAGQSTLSLTRSSSSNTHTRLFPLGPGWARCVLSGALNASDEAVTFALEFPAGVSIDLFGIQAEAQPLPSAYKRTSVRNGVYPIARFDDDVLHQVSDGPDQHRFDLRIVCRD